MPKFGARKRRQLRLFDCCFALAMMASVGEAAEHGAQWSCRPALGYYCANVHVGCAGQSRVRTEAFELRVGSDGLAQVQKRGRAPEVVGTRSGETDSPNQRENNERVFFLSAGGYLRIDANHRFSERIYRDGKGLMSYGQCRRTE